jgi:hypothetical protein
VGKPEGKISINQSINHLEYQDIVDWIILRYILERWDVVVWTGLVWLRLGTIGGLL